MESIQMINSELNILKIASSEFQAQVRPQPVAIVFRGTPGAGKTLLMCRMIVKCFEQKTYFMSALDDFEDGILNSTVVAIDEFMPHRQGDSPDLERFLRMVSSAPYRPNFANLELKGKLASPLIIMLTTNQNLDMINTSFFSEAIRRRFTIQVVFDGSNITLINRGKTFLFSMQKFLDLILAELRIVSFIFNKLIL